MIHPSYTEIMKVVNSEVEPGEQPVVNSRYSIVMATSKRARQLIDGQEAYVDLNGKELVVEKVGSPATNMMTVEDYNWSYLLLQDGSERGKDVFRTNNRWVLDAKNAAYGTMKAESSEPVNLIIVSFK